MLSDIDYLSSVSGGSYIAGWYMTRHLMDDNELFNNAGPQMRYLLSNGNYLTSGHAGSAMTDFTKRGLLHTLTIPFSWMFNGIFSFNRNVGSWGGMSLREVYRNSLADTFLCDYAEALVHDVGIATVKLYDEDVEREEKFLPEIDQLAEKMVPDAIENAVPGLIFKHKPGMTDFLKYARKSATTDEERKRIDALIKYLGTGDPDLQSSRWQEVIKQAAASSTLSRMADYRKRPSIVQRNMKKENTVKGEPRNWHMSDLRISESGLIDASTRETNPFSITSSIRPFWIANAGLGLKDDKTLFKNQFGDNFELTPLYCGADAVGYVKTDAAHNWMGVSYVLQMSGAAVSYTSELVPPMFGSMIRFLNMDLGRYVDSWSYGNGLTSRKAVWALTSFLPIKIVCNMVGFDTGHKRNVKARRHFISDGGFYENLGALTVIRRGCRYVIISDSGQDEQYLEGKGHSRTRAFFDLRRLGLRLRNELGAELILPEKGEDFSGPIMMGEIRNLPVKGSGRETVKIIYIKPTYELKDAAYYARFIEGYKAGEEGTNFPHQTTGDQFFGEVQLTAYRELGYEIVMKNKDTFLQMKEEYSIQNKMTDIQ
jgi:hypothetical protein